MDKVDFTFFSKGKKKKLMIYKSCRIHWPFGCTQSTNPTHCRSRIKNWLWLETTCGFWFVDWGWGWGQFQLLTSLLNGTSYFCFLLPRTYVVGGVI